MRDGLFPLGITLISAGSHTEPGGYTGAGKEKIHQTDRGRIVEARRQRMGHRRHRRDNATGQFDIADERSPEEIARLFAVSATNPVWKDWDGALITKSE